MHEKYVKRMRVTKQQCENGKYCKDSNGPFSQEPKVLDQKQLIQGAP